MMLSREQVQALLAAATPGPWQHGVLGTGFYAVTAAFPDARLGRDRWRWVARCGFLDWDVDKANAELIAAAPVLARMVLDLLDALDVTDRALETAVDEADALLSKQEGGYWDNLNLRDENERLRAALTEIRNLHQPEWVSPEAKAAGKEPWCCELCGTADGHWPCTTADIIDDALGAARALLGDTADG